MPGLVDDLGGRVVVRGQHRQALAVGVHLGDVDDGQAAGGVGRGAHAGSLSGSVVAPVWADASRSSSAAATRSRSASATARLDWSGRSSRDAVGREDRDAVGLGAEPGAGLGDVVGDEEVDALAAQLLVGALERARSRPRTRRAPAADRAAPASRAAVAVEPAGDPGDLGEQVGRGLEPERSGPSSRGSLVSAVVRGPEVGDRGGHDQRVEPGAAVGAVRQRAGARRAGRPSTRPRTTSADGGSGTSVLAAMMRHARTAVERRLRDRRRPSGRSSGCR